MGIFSFVGDALKGLGGPIISGVSSLVGGALQQSSARKAADQAYERNSFESQVQRDWAASQASTARDFESQMADKQMGFQERMSSSAHQREVADLRAAGLNPILSGTGGMGSSSPVGASARASVPSGASASSPVAQAFDIITPALSTAVNLSMAQADMAKKEAETVRTGAETDLLRMKPSEMEAQIKKILAETEYTEQLKVESGHRVNQISQKILEMGANIRLMGQHQVESLARTGKVSEETKALEVDRFLRKQIGELSQGDLGSAFKDVPIDLVKGVLLRFVGSH